MWLGGEPPEEAPEGVFDGGEDRMRKEHSHQKEVTETGTWLSDDRGTMRPLRPKGDHRQRPVLLLGGYRADMFSLPGIWKDH